MRKLFLSLLICIIISLTINFVVYSQEVDMTFDPSSINYSTRDTSEGKMIEFPYSSYNQWLVNYKYLLVENLSQEQTINQWEDNYNQLLDDTIWIDSYNECLSTVEEVELDYQKEVKKNNLLTYGLIGTSFLLLVETIVLIGR